MHLAIQFFTSVYYHIIVNVTYLILISDKIPDDNSFKIGSKDRQSWEADDIADTYRNDTGMFSNSNGHVKFDTPKVPVIFVLGKNVRIFVITSQ